MYDTTIECTYHKTEYSQQEIEYQKDYLRLFQLEEFNLEIINKTVEELYKKLKSSNEMRECIKLAANQMFSEDEILGTMILFSFNYLSYTVPCINTFLNNNLDEHVIAVNNLRNKLLA